MYCKYNREERKKLFQQRIQDPSVHQWTKKEQWPAWNKSFQNVSEDYQDRLWNIYFLNKGWNTMSSLGCCQSAPAPIAFNLSKLNWCNPVSNKVWPCGLTDCKLYEQEEKEKTMRTTSISAPSSYANAQVCAPQSEISEQRAYLLDRLSTIGWQKRDDERKPFGLKDDEEPKTIKERKERIAAGKYTFKFYVDEDGDYDEEGENYYGVGKVTLRWRDPAVKEDQKGYDAAMEKLEKDLTSYRDTIHIMDAETGLKALQEFESKTYH